MAGCMAACLCCACRSGHDYLPPIKGAGLKTVYKHMQRTALPPHICLAPNACHPPLPERPAAWQTIAAIRFFAIGFLAAKLTPSEVEPHFQKLLMAHYAVRHHPVFRLINAGLGWSRSTMDTARTVPLDPLLVPPGGVQWSDRVAGLKFHATDAIALSVARGDTCAATLQPRQLQVPQVADYGSESGSSGYSDHEREVAAPGEDATVDDQAPDLTLETVPNARCRAHHTR